MSWYYADWSWLQTLTTTAALVASCVVLTCAIVNLARSHPTARHAEVVVTNGFAQPSGAEIERQVRHASDRRNGGRAA